MIGRFSFLVLSASALLSLTGQAFAQNIIHSGSQIQLRNQGGLGFPQSPNIQGLPPELQKQLEEIFKQISIQPKLGMRVNDTTMRWGGVRLGKVDANLQQQLGLEEKEGLIVMAVDPISAAEKAGLKASDVLVRVNDKSVPNDLAGFAKLVKDERVDQAADIVVVRGGKEETIKAAKMPAVVQANPNAGGGRIGRPGLPGIVIPRMQINPFLQGPIQKLHLEMTVNGAKMVRKQDGNQFSGEYSKDELRITISGKIENDRANPTEITITQGKEMKKYTSIREVPAQHRLVIQQLMPSPLQGLLMLPTIPDFQNLPNFPGLPVIPRVDE
jgi:hypothetical protein